VEERSRAPRPTDVREAIDIPPLELAIEEDGVLKNAPAPIETPAAGPIAMGSSPIEQLRALLAAGITLGQVREYLDMQREWEAEEARRAFHRAMALFKREDLPPILKSVHVHYELRDNKGVVDYWHEDLFDVVSAITPAMARHGLTLKWVPLQDKGPKGPIRITCTVTHEAGYSESVWLEAMPDTSGYKNDIQAVKSTCSYLERITGLAITGTAAKGQDDDGGRSQYQRTGEDLEPAPRGKPASEPPRERASAPAPGDNKPGLASEKQIAMLSRVCKTKDVPIIDLCAEMGVPGLSDLPRGKVDAALQWIEKAGKRASA
jgi:hypothetical protein